jgi:glycosyltransferase involved in cell wall biosynthesis
MHVLHIIPDLTLGGGGRNLLSVAGRLDREYIRQTVISLGPIVQTARNRLNELSVPYHSDPPHRFVQNAFLAADTVLLHYWHSAKMERLLRQPLPAARIALWALVYGGFAPQILTSKLVAFADRVLVTASATQDLPALKSAPSRPVLIPSVVDFERMEGIGRERKRSGPVRVGYLGYADFIKLHPDFVAMSCAIDRDVLFPVWGPGGAYPKIEAQALEIQQSDRFQLNGPTENIQEAFQSMDVFGYPLSVESYGTSDRSLLEAMYAALPTVVFDRPGLRDLVQDGITGYSVHQPNEYIDAVTKLIDDASSRIGMGRAAKAFVLKNFDPGIVINRLIHELTGLLYTPKRIRKWPGQISPDDGATLFIDALGDHSEPFRKSLQLVPIDPRDNADECLTTISPGMRNAGAGGLFEYRRVFPNDPHISYWCGLALLGSQDYRAALAEFLSARRLGLPAKRLRFWTMEALSGMRAYSSRATSLGGNSICEPT